MCSEIRHFHCAVISIMIKLDCKHLGKRGASAIGDDTQKEAYRKKQPEVCRFQDLVSRIMESTTGGAGGRLRTKHCLAQENGRKKKRLTISSCHFRQKLDIHYTNIDW